jgi:hypothetical protein
MAKAAALRVEKLLSVDFGIGSAEGAAAWMVGNLFSFVAVFS